MRELNRVYEPVAKRQGVRRGSKQERAFAQPRQVGHLCNAAERDHEEVVRTRFRAVRVHDLVLEVYPVHPGVEHVKAPVALKAADGDDHGVRVRGPARHGPQQRREEHADISIYDENAGVACALAVEPVLQLKGRGYATETTAEDEDARARFRELFLGLRLVRDLPPGREYLPDERGATHHRGSQRSCAHCRTSQHSYPPVVWPCRPGRIIERFV